MRLALSLARNLRSKKLSIGASRNYHAATLQNGASNTINSNIISARSSRRYTTHSQLPSEHQMVYEMCRKFADEELAPNAGKWDAEHVFPTEAVDKLVSIVRNYWAHI